MVAGKSSGEPASILAGTVGWCGSARSADGLVETGGSRVPRSAGEDPVVDRGYGEAQADEPARRSDLVYDPVDRVSGAAIKVQRTRGHRRRNPDRGEESARDRRANRVLRQHVGNEGKCRGQSDDKRVVGESKRDGVGSICASGCAVREAGGGVAAGEKPESDAALSGDDRDAECTSRSVDSFRADLEGRAVGS